MFLNNCLVVLSVSYFFLISALPLSIFLCDRFHSPPTIAESSSVPDIVLLGIRICIGKSSARRLYDRLEFQFLGGQNVSVIGSQDDRRLIVDIPRDRTGGLCSCSRCKLERLINVIDRRHADCADRGVKIEKFYKFKGQLRASG